MTSARCQIFGETVDYAMESLPEKVGGERLAEGEELGSNVLHSHELAAVWRSLPRRGAEHVGARFAGAPGKRQVTLTPPFNPALRAKEKEPRGFSAAVDCLVGAGK